MQKFQYSPSSYAVLIRDTGRIKKVYLDTALLRQSFWDLGFQLSEEKIALDNATDQLRQVEEFNDILSPFVIKSMGLDLIADEARDNVLKAEDSLKGGYELICDEEVFLSWSEYHQLFELAQETQNPEDLDFATIFGLEIYR